MNTNWTPFDRYLYRYWKLQAVVILLGFLTAPLSLINPYLTKLIIDKAYGNKDLKLFLILAIAGGSIFVFNSLINALSSYLSQRINRKVHFDMMKDVFRHLHSLSISFFNAKSTGEHVYRMSSDIRSVSDFICNTIPQAITLFPRLLFILVVVFYLNWKLALFATLIVPISYIHPYFFGKWLREITRKMIEKSQGIFKELHEVFSHIHLVKALGKENYEIKRFEGNLKKRIGFELKDAKLSSISSFSSSVLNKVISGLIALYGGYQVIKGTMTLGSLTAVMIYLAQLMGLIDSISRFYETVTVNSVSCQRLAEILDVKPGIQDRGGAVGYSILQGKIEFKGVSFGYKSSLYIKGLDKKNESILKDISFPIGAASNIALVGPSGCGKTTLLNLILRLYEPKKGSILIDDLDMRNIKLESLKEQIGVALQEPFLWNDTIASNILYGNGAENAREDEMIKAAKIAEAHNFILHLPKQYDSIIGEIGCKISEGQKQRIAIARAVIKRPKILILDEAMSSLDSETEEKIVDNIKREFFAKGASAPARGMPASGWSGGKDSTLIVVSHRLSTVKKMDLVYFLEGPSRMNIGTHDSLLRQNQRYRELFATQVEGRAVIDQKIEHLVD